MMNRLCNLFFFFRDFEIVELRLCCRQWGSLNLEVRQNWSWHGTVTSNRISKGNQVVGGGLGDTVADA